MKPRTVWACQPVASMICFAVAPSGRRRRSMDLVALGDARLGGGPPGSSLAGLRGHVQSPRFGAAPRGAAGTDQRLTHPRSRALIRVVQQMVSERPIRAYYRAQSSVLASVPPNQRPQARRNRPLTPPLGGANRRCQRDCCTLCHVVPARPRLGRIVRVFGPPAPDFPINLARQSLNTATFAVC
jgi:hypothetical protein